jgi:hypothetical protein
MFKNSSQPSLTYISTFKTWNQEICGTNSSWKLAVPEIFYFLFFSIVVVHFDFRKTSD